MVNKSITGGVRWGPFTNYTYPFAKLEIYNEKLVLKFPFWQRKAFHPKDIAGFSIYKSLTKGIIIHHKIADYPNPVIFWTWKPNDVLKLLEEFMERTQTKEDPF